MTTPSQPDRGHDSERPQERYSMGGGEIETRYDEYVLKLKQAVKVLKGRTQRGSAEEMRPMDQDNPLDSPKGYDI